MSPEATGLAQAYITYYNFTLRTAGHSMSESRPTFTKRICPEYRNVYFKYDAHGEKNIRTK